MGRVVSEFAGLREEADAKLDAIAQATGFIEHQYVPATLLQNQHLPLLRMVVRTHIGSWLQHNDQPLHLIVRSVMQKQMRAPARRKCGFARQLGEPALVQALDAVWLHDGRAYPGSVASEMRLVRVARRQLQKLAHISRNRARRLDVKKFRLAAPEHDLGFAQQGACAGACRECGQTQIERASGIDRKRGGGTAHQEGRLTMTHVHQNVRKGRERSAQFFRDIFLLFKRREQQPLIRPEP